MSWGRFLDAVFEMAKLRITLLLVIIAAVSYGIEGGFRDGGPGWTGLAVAVVSVGLLAVGIFTLNHWMERESDRAMARTRDRPLASGRFSARFALAWGLGFTAAGIAFSGWAGNLAMAGVALFTAVGYLVVYTPLKHRTRFHTALGALPGATPPLAGALAAAGTVSDHAWLLFAVLVLWQFPHFLSIELLYRDDYDRGRILVVPVADRTGFWSGLQIVAATLGLGVLAFFLFPPGPILLGAEVLTALFLAAGIGTWAPGARKAAKRLLRVSVLYLPLLFILILIQATAAKEVLHG